MMGHNSVIILKSLNILLFFLALKLLKIFYLTLYSCFCSLERIPQVVTVLAYLFIIG